MLNRVSFFGEMKVTITVILAISLTVISVGSYARNLSQEKWGISIMQHIKMHWKPSQSKISEFKDQEAKVKLTVSSSGDISGAIELSCKGSLSFCSSVSKALVRARPFPLPPKNVEKTDNTLVITFD